MSDTEKLAHAVRALRYLSHPAPDSSLTPEQVARQTIEEIERWEPCQGCMYCGACKAHPGVDGNRCWDSEDGKHRWNRPHRNPPDTRSLGQL